MTGRCPARATRPAVPVTRRRCRRHRRPAQRHVAGAREPGGDDRCAWAAARDHGRAAPPADRRPLARRPVDHADRVARHPRRTAARDRRRALPRRAMPVPQPHRRRVRRRPPPRRPRVSAGPAPRVARRRRCLPLRHPARPAATTGPRARRRRRSRSSPPGAAGRGRRARTARPAASRRGQSGLASAPWPSETRSAWPSAQHALGERRVVQAAVGDHRHAERRAARARSGCRPGASSEDSSQCAPSLATWTYAGRPGASAANSASGSSQR